MATPHNTLLLLATTALLGACQSTGLGTVPPQLVELYDLGDPAGIIELELARDGTILEMEADVPVDALPAAVREAALARLPGARITGGEREIQASGRCWEVKLDLAGVAWELVLDDAGTVVETEQEIGRADAPAAVLAAADTAVPGGSFVSVERIERGGRTEYHVKKARDGASYKIVLAADGTVHRAVREARAEIEIPLR